MEPVPPTKTVAQAYATDLLQAIDVYKHAPKHRAALREVIAVRTWQVLAQANDIVFPVRMPVPTYHANKTQTVDLVRAVSKAFANHSPPHGAHPTVNLVTPKANVEQVTSATTAPPPKGTVCRLVEKVAFAQVAQPVSLLLQESTSVCLTRDASNPAKQTIIAAKDTSVKKISASAPKVVKPVIFAQKLPPVQMVIRVPQTLTVTAVSKTVALPQEQPETNVTKESAAMA